MASQEISALAARLLKRVDELAAAMAARIRSRAPEYHYDVVAPDDLAQICRDHIANALNAISGQAPLDTTVSTASGRRRAAQNVPLPTVMTGYRIGVRYLWEAIVGEAAATGLVDNDALVAAASEVWEIQDRITDGMVSGYHEAAAERLLAREQERSALVEALLDGRNMTPDAVWSAADVLGVPHNGPFRVVAAEVPEIGRQALPQAETLLRRRGLLSAWRLRPDLQIGIVHVRSPRELDTLTEVLREHARRRVGCSPCYHDFDETGKALRFAKVALLGGDAGGRAVTVFDAAPIEVATAAAPDVMAVVAAGVLGPLDALPPAERDLLLDTLDAWFDCGGSAEETAKRLFCHPNTVRLRLRRITERTGRSLTDPRGITELAIALRAVRQQPDARPESPESPPPPRPRPALNAEA